jgi:glycerol-3-phosphate dehydrogenase
MVYTDAKTDDARLVLRVLQERGAWRRSAQLYGGAGLLRDGEQGGGHGDGQGSGPVREQISGSLRRAGARCRAICRRRRALRARVVISATGAWADGLRLQAGKTAAFRHSAAAGWCRRNGGAASTEAQLRPLRGSHLVLPAWRLPLAQAIS